MSNTWKKYQKTAIQEMRNYINGEDLTGVSVAPGETPKLGGMIARDKQGSRWYVSPEFMSENYQEVVSEALPDTQEQRWRGIEELLEALKSTTTMMEEYSYRLMLRGDGGEKNILRVIEKYEKMLKEK